MQQLLTYLDKDLPLIFTSEAGLKQILQNIISNSIRYRKTDIPNPYAIIMITADDDNYIFKVTDNGIGMSKKQLKKSFELFNKNKNFKDSTGIGLNITKRIIEKMNGEIVIDSKENHGTEITFTLPKIMKML